MHPQLIKPPAASLRNLRQVLLLVVLSIFTLPLYAAEPAQPPNLIKLTDAVAFMRVIKVSEELHDKVVEHIVTLSLCGRATGLGELTELALPFEPPTNKDGTTPEKPEPLFSVGQRYLVLLTAHDEHWQLLRKFPVSEEGKLMTDETWLAQELKVGTEANIAVQLITDKITKENHAPRARPPAVATPRNQPWNLMRASPLRRVWPFFPR